MHKCGLYNTGPCWSHSCDRKDFEFHLLQFSPLPRLLPDFGSSWAPFPRLLPDFGLSCGPSEISKTTA